MINSIPEVDTLLTWHGINPSLYYTSEPTYDDCIHRKLIASSITNGCFRVAYITPPDMQPFWTDSEIDYESMEWNRFDASIELGCALG